MVIINYLFNKIFNYEKNIFSKKDDLLKNKESALLIGIQGNQVVLTPIIELKEKTDFKLVKILYFIFLEENNKN